MFELYDYQKEAVNRIKSGANTWLIYPMGKGKTLITLAAISEMIKEGKVKKVLILAPLRVCETTWKEEPEKFEHLDNVRFTFYRGTPSKRKELINEHNNLYLVNNELLNNFVADYLEKFKTWDFDLLVVDESSQYKSYSTKRFKIMKLITPKTKQVLLLTGTPLPKDYIEVYAQVYYLDNGKRLGKSMTAYKRRFFYPLNYDTRKPYIVYNWGITEENKHKINDLISDLVVTLEPEKSKAEKKIFFCDLNTEAREIYETMKRNYLVEFENMENANKKAIAVNSAGVVAKLQQIASGTVYLKDKTSKTVHDEKLKAVLKILEIHKDSNVLLFYQYVDQKEYIINELKKANVNVRELKNEQDKKDWDFGTIRVLVAHPASCGYGINLQFGGNVIIWYSLPFSLEHYQQANARLDRPGQKNQVYIYHIIARDTVDMQILETLKNRSLNQKDFIKILYDKHCTF